MGKRERREAQEISIKSHPVPSLINLDLVSFSLISFIRSASLQRRRRILDFLSELRIDIDARYKGEASELVRVVGLSIGQPHFIEQSPIPGVGVIVVFCILGDHRIHMIDIRVGLNEDCLILV